MKQMKQAPSRSSWRLAAEYPKSEFCRMHIKWLGDCLLIELTLKKHKSGSRKLLRLRLVHSM